MHKNYLTVIPNNGAAANQGSLVGCVSKLPALSENGPVAELDTLGGIVALLVFIYL